MNTLTPRQGHSPHHAYHSALHQIRAVEATVESAELSESPIPREERREIARRILEAWRRSGGGTAGDDVSGPYLHRR
ncbi:MAG: hypothetical protein AAF488_07135 [Planctomycetota bacterium]